MRFGAPILALTLLPALASAQDGGVLELRALDGSMRSLAPAEMAQVGLQVITVLDEGVPATYVGPSLLDLAALVGAPRGRGLRGPAMALALLAEASDGYAVGFMLSELDGQFGGRAAIVALSREGAPLAGGDGPMRIVVPDDEFHARWVRSVIRLSLVDVNRALDRRGAR
jgi:hypothetical protein